MSRLLVVKENSWYYKLSEVAFYREADFEGMLLQHARAIFPDFLTIPFKKEIKDSNNERKKPDCALIRNDFKEWWIVEIELSDHPIDHVKQQVTVFLNGDYTNYDELVEYMFKQIRIHHRHRKISKSKILHLVKKNIPSVLVIVDSKKEEWENEFRRMNVNVCVMEIYRNNLSRYSYRLAGKYPYVVRKESPCRFDPTLNNTLQITETSILVGKNGEVDITYDDALTTWTIIRDGNRVYIKYIGLGIPLTVMNTFVLKMSSKGKLFLERS